MLVTLENEASFIDILIVICMIKIGLLVRMTERPCRLLCLAKMRHLLSGVTARERSALLSIWTPFLPASVAPFKCIPFYLAPWPERPRLSNAMGVGANLHATFLVFCHFHSFLRRNLVCFFIKSSQKLGLSSF